MSPRPGIRVTPIDFAPFPDLVLADIACHAVVRAAPPWTGRLTGVRVDSGGGNKKGPIMAVQRAAASATQTFARANFRSRVCIDKLRACMLCPARPCRLWATTAIATHIICGGRATRRDGKPGCVSECFPSGSSARSEPRDWAAASPEAHDAIPELTGRGNQSRTRGPNRSLSYVSSPLLSTTRARLLWFDHACTGVSHALHPIAEARGRRDGLITLAVWC